MGELPDGTEVAHAFCALSGWKLTFQGIKAMVSTAQAVHLARHGVPICSDRFVASDQGPTSAGIRRAHAGHGARAVRRPPPPFRLPFTKPRPPRPSRIGAEARATIEEVWRTMKDMGPGTFISFTHAEGSAWARFYRPGFDIPIPEGAMAAWGASLLVPRREPAERRAEGTMGKKGFAVKTRAHDLDLAIDWIGTPASGYVDDDYQTLTRHANAAIARRVKGETSTFEIEGTAFVATMGHGVIAVARA